MTYASGSQAPDDMDGAGPAPAPHFLSTFATIPLSASAQTSGSASGPAPTFAPGSAPTSTPAPSAEQSATGKKPRDFPTGKIKDAPNKNLDFPTGNLTAAEIVAFFPQWIKSFDIVERFASNGATSTVLKKMINTYRDMPNGPIYDNVILRMMQKAVRHRSLEPRFHKWAPGKHQPSPNFDPTSVSVTGFRPPRITHPTGRGNEDQVADPILFKELGRGVKAWPMGDDTLDLTRCIDYHLAHPNEVWWFPTDFDRLVQHIGQAIVKPENHDSEVFKRWKAKIPPPTLHRPHTGTAAFPVQNPILPVAAAPTNSRRRPRGPPPAPQVTNAPFRVGQLGQDADAPYYEDDEFEDLLQHPTKRRHLGKSYGQQGSVEDGHRLFDQQQNSMFMQQAQTLPVLQSATSSYPGSMLATHGLEGLFGSRPDSNISGGPTLGASAQAIAEEGPRSQPDLNQLPPIFGLPDDGEPELSETGFPQFPVPAEDNIGQDQPQLSNFGPPSNQVTAENNTDDGLPQLSNPGFSSIPVTAEDNTGYGQSQHSDPVFTSIPVPTEGDADQEPPQEPILAVDTTGQIVVLDPDRTDPNYFRNGYQYLRTMLFPDAHLVDDFAENVRWVLSGEAGAFTNFLTAHPAHQDMVTQIRENTSWTSMEKADALFAELSEMFPDMEPLFSEVESDVPVAAGGSEGPEV